IGWLARPADDAGEVDPPRRHLPALATVGVLLLATVYAAWDYTRVSQIYLPPEERSAAWRDDALEHARQSWLFSAQARFADLTLAGLYRDNARWMDALSARMLHYSPEPRMIERAIESATMLGREDEAVLNLARYRAAFPKDYARWREAQRLPLPAASMSRPGS
ncbi:MAG: O-antigen polymerase, partial [Ramlibacter sp.]|nr:O-antigen polymerase [Ramlibacter sp.]